MVAPPHFLILGAQKAGTTWLTSVLNSLDTFQKSRKKETRFLFANWRPEYDQMPTEDVLNLYQENWDLPPTGITFEASPGYVAHPEVIHRIKNLGLSPKFVILLRDPVQRLISLHHMWERNRGLSAGFEEHWRGALDQVVRKRDEVQDENAWYRSIKTGPNASVKGIAHGLYLFQLRAWVSAFGPDSFFITKTSRISDPNELLSLVRFCGDETSSFEDVQKALKIEVSNRSLAAPPPETELVPFRGFFEPYNKKLMEEFGVDLSC
jgi:hypothetical protein